MLHKRKIRRNLLKGEKFSEYIVDKFVKNKLKVPISHCDPEQHLKLKTKKSPRAIIGSSKSRFDVTKMTSINSSLWSKGLFA